MLQQLVVEAGAELRIAQVQLKERVGKMKAEVREREAEVREREAEVRERDERVAMLEARLEMVKMKLTISNTELLRFKRACVRACLCMYGRLGGDST